MTDEIMNMDDAYVDLTKLNDVELRIHILKLCNLRRAHGGEQAFSHEIAVVLMIAAAEKNSRASSRLAKVAIGIALVGLAVAVAGTWR